MANIHKYTSYNNEIDSSFKNCVLLCLSLGIGNSLHYILPKNVNVKNV